MELVKKPTRGSKLDAWFAQHRVQKRRAAEALGVSPARFTQLLKGIYLTQEWRARLVQELGIPERLLPEHDDGH
jgi:plasmid maintenance system antidote protein VapI